VLGDSMITHGYRKARKTRKFRSTTLHPILSYYQISRFYI